MWTSEKTDNHTFELDEIYWFIERKAKTKTRENVYICLQISRNPRQIVSFSVETELSAKNLQKLVDNAMPAQNYATDGFLSYLGVDFLGSQHIRNVKNKCDTHNIESVNADLRGIIFRFWREGVDVSHEKSKLYEQF